jgi:hypothetical protein
MLQCDFCNKSSSDIICGRIVRICPECFELASKPSIFEYPPVQMEMFPPEECMECGWGELLQMLGEPIERCRECEG